MKSFRNPKYLERYEDVIFDLEQPLVTADPANNVAQVRAPNLKFIADNTGRLLHLIGITRGCQWILN